MTSERSRISDTIRQILRSAYAKDPATGTALEALAHPGVQAAVAHQLAHRLHSHGHRALARLLATLARIVTGLDVHPAARIDPTVFIDHALGVVIGETATIEHDAMLYHHVTLGSIGWWKDKGFAVRHPTIGAHTVLCVGSSVLGAITVGAHVIVGAHAVVLADVPDNTHVRAGSVWSARHRDAAESAGASHILSTR
ncbi:serine O-acetyltransferase [Nocardia sp. alder85J]|uniref:serine O-acetyltransferase n=1 Tax=Nocardia sp. alder85J TaxID=2862949 RepID=UPI001CD29C79|nr:serine O-acetyltransferase [Nocardia sp. alder85J]MCX4091981.1 serine O-acetyltransferase [Nocardia sp. alder85J]